MYVAASTRGVMGCLVVRYISQIPPNKIAVCHF